MTIATCIMGAGRSAILSIAATVSNNSGFNQTHSGLVMLSATQALLVYNDTNNGNKGTAVIIDIAGNGITVGTPTVFKNSSTVGASVCRLTATSAFVVYTGGGCVLSVSGSTITANAETTANAPSTLAGNEYAVCALTATTVLIGWYYAASEKYSVMAATISGTAVTFGGTDRNGTQTVGANIYPSFVALTSTTALFSWRQPSTNEAKSVVVTCSSGTTVSFGSSAVIASNINNATFPLSACSISATAALMVYGDTTASKGYAQVVSVSGTTVTTNSPVQISANYGSNYAVGKLSTDNYVCAYTLADASATKAQIITVSGTTPSSPSAGIVTLDSSGAAPDMNIAVLSASKMLFGYEKPSAATDCRLKIGNY